MTSRLPDLVLDSRLRTEFFDSTTTHSYLEIDDNGRRFTRIESWKREQFLGRGGFGEVRLEKCVTMGAKQGSVRAVKSIDKPRDSSGSMGYNKELEAIAKFSNDRYRRWFVKSFGWFENPTAIFVTMEHCRHGDLQHYLKTKKSIPAAEAQQLAHQMLEGLDQMHQNGFVHRDLKPGNILIKSMPPEEKWWVVLADFGISKRADERNGTTSAVKGTTAFMAPELLGFLDRTRHNFTLDPKAADMWALGEIIFRMLTGEAAFQTPGELMTYCMGLRDFPSNRLPMSAVDKIYEFVTNLMMVLPQDRSTTAQCIQHCWMESLVEAEFGALNLEQSELPVTQVSSAEETSARWSSLSNSNYESTQTGIKDRTLRITRKAGPPGNVSPVPDFEAAAVAVLGERMEDGEPLQITDCFIVCSAGAVTVELMSYMIRALQPPQIEERVIRDSQYSYSPFIDIAFERYIKTIVGESQWKNLRPRYKEKMMREFQGIKRIFNGDDSIFCVDLWGVEDDPATGIDDETITLPPSTLKKIFDPYIYQILRLVKTQVEQLEEFGDTPKAILFMGDFGADRYIIQQLERAYKTIGITIFRVVSV